MRSCATSRSEIWRNIWQKKYDPLHEAPAHTRDGYDLFTADQLKQFFGFFLDKIRISQSDQVLEVGCGAGAFLQELPPCRRICGVDYSENAIKLIRRRFRGDYHVAEAAKLPFRDGEFDVVICFGVFLYFDSLEYARRAFKEILRVAKPSSRILIGEINDLHKKDIADHIRKSEDAKRKSNQLCSVDMTHFYYEKDFFEELTQIHGLNITFYDENVPELDFYTPGKYRFSLVIEKRS